MSIYDASRAYIEAGTPLVVLGGKEYGSGSSRDWAAKGTALLGVRAVLVESFERIHRSNLIGMGVLPLQFKPGESADSLGLTGQETFDITGIEEINSGDTPNEVMVTADGKEFTAVVRIDTPGEADYYRHGGIMQYVLRSPARGRRARAAAPPPPPPPPPWRAVVRIDTPGEAEYYRHGGIMQYVLRSLREAGEPVDPGRVVPSLPAQLGPPRRR